MEWLSLDQTRSKIVRVSVRFQASKLSQSGLHRPASGMMNKTLGLDILVVSYSETIAIQSRFSKSDPSHSGSL